MRGLKKQIGLIIRKKKGSTKNTTKIKIGSIKHIMMKKIGFTNSTVKIRKD